MFKKFKKLIMVMIIAAVTIIPPALTTTAGSYACTEKEAAYKGTAITTEYEYIVKSNGWTLFDMSYDGIVGSTNYYNDTIDFEGYCGIKAHCSGSKVTATMYSHIAKVYYEGTLSIKSLTDNKTVTLGDIKTDESITFDIKDVIKKMGLTDGTGNYFLSLKPNEEETINMMLWYEDGYVYTTHYNHDSEYSIKKWDELTKDIDPDKCLGMWVGNENNPITYPTSGAGNSCVHVQEWCDLSDEIILKDYWTDEFKTLRIVEYLTKNYAYDDWRASINNNKSRAYKNNTYYKDENFMFYNYCGQCWDFANASVIMLRHQGIPATTVENYGHTMTAVYLNGKWYGIDCSVLASHHTWEEDTSKEYWLEQRDGGYRAYYGFHDQYMESYNQAIATYETLSFNGSGYNPL